MTLLPWAILSALIILKLEGKLTVRSFFKLTMYAALLVVLSAVMLAGVILPVVFAGFIAFFSLRVLGRRVTKTPEDPEGHVYASDFRVTKKDKIVQTMAGILLMLFAGTAAWSYQQALAQGKVWKLSRYVTGSPGSALISDYAKKGTLSPQELVDLSQSSDPQVADLAIKIMVRSSEYQKNSADIALIEQTLTRANKRQELKDFRSGLPDEFQPEPSPTPSHAK